MSILTGQYAVSRSAPVTRAWAYTIDKTRQILWREL